MERERERKNNKKEEIYIVQNSLRRKREKCERERTFDLF